MPRTGATQAKDRRKHPRTSIRIPVNVVTDDQGRQSVTTNLSRSGICCLLEDLVPAFTRVSVSLFFPCDQSEEFNHVTCRGVVVRQEKVKDRESSYYETAIFFHDLDEKASEIIGRHVDSLSE